MKKVANVLVNVIIALFAVVFVAMLVGPNYGWGTHPVLSSSMEPELQVGGVVVVRPEKIEKIEKGDVITFHSEGRLITHRVVEIHQIDDRPWFETQGDNNNRPDENLVSSEKGVMRKVICFIPYVGYATKILENRTLFSIIIGVVGIYLISNILLEMRSCIREENKKKSERRKENENENAFADIAPSCVSDPDRDRDVFFLRRRGGRRRQHLHRRKTRPKT